MEGADLNENNPNLGYGNKEATNDNQEVAEGTASTPAEQNRDHEDENAISTSDEGEGPKMEPLVGQPLSREGRVVTECHGDENSPIPDPKTPERGTSSPEVDKDTSTVAAVDEEAEEGVDGGAHAEVYRQLCAEREELSQHNGQLQVKLWEYFRTKTGGAAQSENGKLASDSGQQQRYEKYMTILEDLKWEQAQNTETARQQSEVLKAQTQEKLQQVETEWQEFVALKRGMATAVLGRRLGRRAARAKAEEILACVQHREDELVRVRLEHIKLKNRVQQMEGTLCWGKLAEGLQLLDFEQKKAEKQESNEKCNEEVLKLRKKITSTIEVLTHVKQKLQWSQTENQARQAELAEWDALVAKKRELLTRSKKACNSLRAGNLELKQRCGMRGNRVLLRDFEDKMDACRILEDGVVSLQQRYSESVLKSAGWKKKLGSASL